MDLVAEKTFTILIVDDEAVFRKILRLTFQREGYQTLLAANGSEARTLAREHLPDLIFLDIMMAGESGFDVCEKLKTDPLTAEIPIIFVSAFNEVTRKVEGFNLGAVDYICKPIQAEEVLARARIHLQNSLGRKTLIEKQTARIKQIADAQQSILVRPRDLPGARFGVCYEPFEAASGDFYEVFPVSDDLYGYFIADISGHDLGASYITSALKAVIQQNTTPIYMPAESLTIINRVLSGILRPGDHITACYARLNRALLKLTLLYAGHPPAILLTGKEARAVEGNGDVLGAFGNVHFDPVEVKVHPGDRFFLYTDGLIEGFGSKRLNRKTGIERLMQACVQTRNIPIDEAVQAIARSLGPQDQPRQDDITLLGVEV